MGLCLEYLWQGKIGFSLCSQLRNGVAQEFWVLPDIMKGTAWHWEGVSQAVYSRL